MISVKLSFEAPFFLADQGAVALPDANLYTRQAAANEIAPTRLYLMMFALELSINMIDKSIIL